MTALDPELERILPEARRVAGADVPWHVQAKDGESCIMFQIVADDALLSRRLKSSLEAFCDRKGCARRFLVARSTPTEFRDGPRMPDGWPP